MADAFGKALHDHHHDSRSAPLIQRDGEESLEHPIKQFYFTEFDPTGDPGEWLTEQLSGSLLDMGAGVGKHALHFQEEFETVALESSEHLVSIMHERGVEDPRAGDMFALREQFDRDRFTSALAYGTQVGLAKSMDGLRSFLDGLAYVTEPGATAVIDSYDPTVDETADLLGYRSDPTPGLAFRVMTFEYEGTVDPTLLFRLFSPDRLREAAVGTGWEITEIRRGSNEYHYLAALEKR
jgi:hypothetical protein